MHPVRPVALSRASGACSSLAVTVMLAALTILALAFGTVQNTKAESVPGTMPGGTPASPPSHHEDFR